MTAARTRRWLGLALLVYGSVGIVVMLRLLPIAAQAVSLWFGANPDAVRPAIPLLGPLEAHYDPRPWLAWLAWLIGMHLFIWSPLPHIAEAIEPTVPITPPNSNLKPQTSNLLVAALLILALIGLGAYARLNLLVPQERGLIEYPYDDEGVYAEASQLTLQGILPYRDYFFAHPPVAALVYIPAFAYHFTAWGSPTSFMLGRYLSVGYSLLTALALFLLGRKSARSVGATEANALAVGGLAALLWAIDGQVVEINRKVMLDQPMVLFSSLALLCYLYALPHEDVPPHHYRRWLVAAGICAALAALTKIAGLAAVLAIFVHAASVQIKYWQQRRRARLSMEEQVGEEGMINHAPTAVIDKANDDSPLQIASNSNLKPQTSNLIAWLGLGFFATALIVLLPYLIVAPGQMVREVFFFQLLRPGDGTADVASRLPLISGAMAGAITSNPLTLVGAALGSLMLGWVAVRSGKLAGWTPIILWNIFSFALFTYTRSFYTHYYIQLAAPLCLLGGAAAMWFAHRSRSMPVFFYPAVAAIIALLVSPLGLVQWRAFTTARPDPMFRDVAKYINDAVPPNTSVFTLDDQFNFLAARPPSYLPATGYVVDSYGHMIYLGLHIGQRSIADLIGGVLHDPRSDDPYATMWQDAPQQDMRQRMQLSPLIVIHAGGEGRLRKDTLEQLTQMAKVQPDASTSRYTIYRK